MHRYRPPIANTNGFTLLEIAIVMVIIGILAGGGVGLMRMLTERKARNATVDYLQQVRTALVSYAANNGRLPWADSDADGAENSGAAMGTLPYLTLQIAPADAYRRNLRYEINANLATGRTATCTALRAGLTIRPQVVDADGVATAFSVAAVLVSAGPMDADSNGSVFDALTAGTHQGNNASGNPNYLRNPPVLAFDDLTAYIGGNELSAHVCQYLDVAVNNYSGFTVYVHDASQNVDIASLPDGNVGNYTVISGTRIELNNAPGGCCTVLSSPSTPVILAGQDATLNLP
jgi:prepilin-type N-terminal cleavage/methylation domain-containing protein